MGGATALLPLVARDGSDGLDGRGGVGRDWALGREGSGGMDGASICRAIRGTEDVDFEV